MLMLEVIEVPVHDVDASMRFYTEQLGFRLDVDYRPSAGFRVLQLTPPQSACSIHLVEARSERRLSGICLVTEDLQRTVDELRVRGVMVQALRHKSPWATWAGGFAAGLDPERRDYSSFAEFTDPDGNVWTLQERGFAAAA